MVRLKRGDAGLAPLRGSFADRNLYGHALAYIRRPVHIFLFRMRR